MRSVVILGDVGSCMRGAETMDPRKVFFPPSMACASYRVMFLLLRLKLHIYDRLMNKCAFDYLFPGVFQHPLFLMRLSSLIFHFHLQSMHLVRAGGEISGEKICLAALEHFFEARQF